MTTKHKTRAAVFAFTVAFLAPEGVSAQTRGTVNPQPLPTLAKPDDPATPAKELFGRRSMPAPVEARVRLVIQGLFAGALGCRSTARLGGEPCGIGFWGYPHLVQFLERLADTGPKVGWRGLLVGDRRSRATAGCSPATPAIRSASTLTSGSRGCPIASLGGASATTCRRP